VPLNDHSHVPTPHTPVRYDADFTVADTNSFSIQSAAPTANMGGVGCKEQVTITRR
jgi:hypothetical protein